MIERTVFFVVVHRCLPHLTLSEICQVSLVVIVKKAAMELEVDSENFPWRLNSTLRTTTERKIHYFALYTTRKRNNRFGHVSWRHMVNKDGDSSVESEPPPLALGPFFGRRDLAHGWRRKGHVHRHLHKALFTCRSFFREYKEGNMRHVKGCHFG